MGLDTRIVGSSVLARLSDPDDRDAWIDTTQGLMSISFDQGTRTYGINHGEEPPNDLAKVRARSERWELRETPGKVQFRDARSGFTSLADRAIKDGRLLQDEVEAIGTEAEGVWLRTKKTLERGDTADPGAWKSRPVPSRYEPPARPADWARRVESGDRVALGDPAIQSERDRTWIRVAGREVLEVPPAGHVLRPDDRGLWVVRRGGGSTWPVQWIKPAAKWHR